MRNLNKSKNEKKYMINDQNILFGETPPPHEKYKKSKNDKQTIFINVHNIFL